MKRTLLAFLVSISAALAGAQSNYTLVPSAQGAPNPSGGTEVLSSPPRSYSYAMMSGGQYRSPEIGGGNSTLTCSGDMDYHFKWSGGTTRPTPSCVVVQVTSSAEFYGAPGACDDGLGDPFVGVLPYGGTCSGTHLKIVNNPGSDFHFKVSPSASCTIGDCYVYSIVSISDVNLNVLGGLGTTTPDECLIGQGQISSFYTGLGQLQNYQWSISGPGGLLAGATWGTNGSSHSWVYPSAASYTQPSMSFYGGLPGDEWVSCSANLYDTVNKVVVGPVSGMYHMSVKAPSYFYLGLSPGQTCLLDSKTRVLDNALAGQPSYFTAGNANQQGMQFAYATELPTELQAEGLGGSGIVQIIHKIAYTMSWISGPSGSYDSGPILSVDTAYPYTINGGPFPCDGTGHVSVDSPAVGLAESTTYGGLNDIYTTSVSANNQFDMFLFFSPPTGGTVSSTLTVPLIDQEWSWVSSDSIGTISNIWLAPTGNATPGSSTDLPLDTFYWTAIIKGFSSIPWVY